MRVVLQRSQVLYPIDVGRDPGTNALHYVRFPLIGSAKVGKKRRLSIYLPEKFGDRFIKNAPIPSAASADRPNCS